MLETNLDLSTELEIQNQILETCLSRAPRASVLVSPIYVTSDSAKNTSNRLFSAWMTLFGVPATILTDRDKKWKSDFLATFVVRSFGGEVRMKTGNPQLLQLHGTNSKGRPKSVGKTLRAFFVNHQHDWRERLPAVELAINSAADRTTGFSPSEIAFGRKIRLSDSKPQKSQANTVAHQPLSITRPSDQACSANTLPTAPIPFADPVVRALDNTEKFCHLKLQLARSLEVVTKLKTDFQAASDTIQDLKSRNKLLESESIRCINLCVTAQHEIGRLTGLETSLKKSNQGLINLSVKLLTTTDQYTTDRSQPRRLVRTRPVRPQKTNQSASCQHLHHSPAQQLQPDLPPRLLLCQTPHQSRSGPFAKPRPPLRPLRQYPSSNKHNEGLILEGHINLDHLLYPISSPLVKTSLPPPSHELLLHELSLAACSRSY
ncbi:hypothetical protein PSTT_14633 [Puccinia striiformis]|uniref:Integrase catalytic domain-containing protein n=1 Tax=Puccinia striiformis TaxID=27350 RepID=A0A2S4ULA6_9BASI|nr:hypothetical protein PSTT_14633 [Puccinia striiformis]